MGRQDFIEGLRRALNGNVSPALVTDNLNYYNEYINSEIRKGRSEKEVLEALGDPRLIARTIIETNTVENGEESAYQTGEFSQGYGEFRQAQGGYDGVYQSGYGKNQGYYEEGYGHSARRQNTYDQGNGKQYRIPGWVWLVLFVVAVVMVISFVFSVLSFLAPVIIPLILVVFLIKLFRDWLN